MGRSISQADPSARRQPVRAGALKALPQLKRPITASSVTGHAAVASSVQQPWL
jgi:hypothetical protein